MEPIDVFSKITYLEEGMKKLLAEKAASSAEIQQLLAAVEAKAQPTVAFDTEALAMHVAPLLAAKMPALDAATVAWQIGALLLGELPTPATLRQAGDEAAAKLNQEFSRQEQRMRACVEKLGGWLATIEKRVVKLVDGIPHTVGLDAFYDVRVFLTVFSVPLVCILALMFHSLVMRVSKEQYERVSASNEQIAHVGLFYSNQIKEYKRKFPKQAVYFRDYHPTPPAQPVEPTVQ